MLAYTYSTVKIHTSDGRFRSEFAIIVRFTAYFKNKKEKKPAWHSARDTILTRYTPCRRTLPNSSRFTRIRKKHTHARARALCIGARLCQHIRTHAENNNFAIPY